MAETVVVSMKITITPAPDKEWKSNAIDYPDDAAGRSNAEARAIAEVINRASEGHGVNRSSFLEDVKMYIGLASQTR